MVRAPPHPRRGKQGDMPRTEDREEGGTKPRRNSNSRPNSRPSVPAARWGLPFTALPLDEEELKITHPAPPKCVRIW